MPCVVSKEKGSLLFIIVNKSHEKTKTVTVLVRLSYGFCLPHLPCQSKAHLFPMNIYIFIIHS